MRKTKLKPMTERESRILSALKRARKPLTIREMAREAFPGIRPVERADTTVRNSLRRHRDDKTIKQTGRGTYAARA
jgi:hypothetical protein